MARKTNELEEEVRTILLDSGLTQREIAETCKVHESRVSRFLRGRGGMNLKTLDKICQGLNVRVLFSVLS